MRLSAARWMIPAVTSSYLASKEWRLVGGVGARRGQRRSAETERQRPGRRELRIVQSVPARRATPGPRLNEHGQRGPSVELANKPRRTHALRVRSNAAAVAARDEVRDGVRVGGASSGSERERVRILAGVGEDPGELAQHRNAAAATGRDGDVDVGTVTGDVLIADGDDLLRRQAGAEAEANQDVGVLSGGPQWTARVPSSSPIRLHVGRRGRRGHSLGSGGSRVDGALERCSAMRSRSDRRFPRAAAVSCPQPTCA